MNPRLIVNVVLSLVVLGGASLGVRWLVEHKKEPGQRTPDRVVPKVVAPAIEARRDEHVKVVGYGSVKPKIRVNITPQVSGIIVEKSDNFISGKYVGAGEVLLRIEETDYRLAAERVEKNIELLKTQVERLNQEELNLEESARIERERLELGQSQVDKVKRLVERNAASDNELDQAKEALLSREVQLQSILNQLALIGPQRGQLEAEMGLARVELKQTQTNLSRCVIKSPVVGQVLGCDVEVGEQAAAGGVCGQVYGTRIMEVPVSVTYSDLEWIDKGLLVGKGIEALVEWERPGSGENISWQGYVDRIEAGLEAQTRMASVIVQVENPRENEDKPMLEANMFCKVTVLGKKLAEVYVLPRQAIGPDGSVYVVNSGKLNKKAVTVARMGGEEAMVLPGGGLIAGDKVVISTMSKPVIGMSVETTEE